MSYLIEIPSKTYFIEVFDSATPVRLRNSAAWDQPGAAQAVLNQGRMR